AAAAPKSPTTVPSVGCSIGVLDLITRYLSAVPHSQSSPGAVHWSVALEPVLAVIPSARGVPGGRVSVPYAPVPHSSWRDVHHSSFVPHAELSVSHVNMLPSRV